jgi:hypothetical protein
MLVACFCGHTAYTIQEEDALLCGHCGLQVHPPEVVVPLGLREEIRQVLDRIERWVNDDRFGTTS